MASVKLDAALRALLGFQPTVLPGTGRGPGDERTRWDPVADELIRLASQFVVALGATHVPSLEANVAEVHDAMRVGTLLRDTLDAFDALLERKLQEIKDAIKAVKPGTVGLDLLASEIPVDPTVLIEFCQASGIYVISRMQSVDPKRRKAIKTLLAQVLPEGKRAVRVPINHFARNLGVSIQELRQRLRRVDVEEERAGYLNLFEQNTAVLLVKMPQTQVRAFEMARELNVTDTDLLDVCRRLGLDVKNRLSKVNLGNRNAIVDALHRAGNDPGAVPAGSPSLERQGLEEIRDRVSELKRWLDDPVLPEAGEQLLAFTHQRFSVFTDKEAAEVVLPLREQAWELVELTRRNYYLGARILLACGKTPRAENQQQLLDWCAKDIGKARAAVQGAALALYSAAGPTAPSRTAARSPQAAKDPPLAANAVLFSIGENNYLLRRGSRPFLMVTEDFTRFLTPFVFKVREGSASETVYCTELNKCADLHDSSVANTASVKLRKLVSKINQKLKDAFDPPPDKKGFIVSWKRYGYYLNSSLEWSLDRRLAAKISDTSASSTPTDPSVIAEAQPERGTKLQARARRDKGPVDDPQNDR